MSTGIRPIFKAMFFSALILLVLVLVGGSIMFILVLVKGGG